MLGVFAKVVRGQSVKSRLQTRLSRQDAELFYVASLADTLETALEVDAAPVLFLQGGEDSTAVADLRSRLESIGLDAAAWPCLVIQTQRGANLGLRLEKAFEFMLASGHERGEAEPAALILGSDSPSLTAAMLRTGFVPLTDADPAGGVADVVLGPTRDGGYWSIGVRQPLSGLLRDVAWSTARTLEDTRARCLDAGLRVALLEAWTDVDHPEDLQTLKQQITRLRQRGDARTARHTERVVRRLKDLST